MGNRTVAPLFRRIGEWLVENYACRKCNMMHRRAQAAESAAAKAVRQNDHDRLWRTVDSLRQWRDYDHRKLVLWRWRYRALVAAALAHGMTNEEVRRACAAGDAERMKLCPKFQVTRIAS